MGTNYYHYWNPINICWVSKHWHEWLIIQSILSTNKQWAEGQQVAGLCSCQASPLEAAEPWRSGQPSVHSLLPRRPRKAARGPGRVKGRAGWGGGGGGGLRGCSTRSFGNSTARKEHTVHAQQILEPPADVPVPLPPRYGKARGTKSWVKAGKGLLARESDGWVLLLLTFMALGAGRRLAPQSAS